MLICVACDVACDLPAGRKICGFLSHAARARLGCSKCYNALSVTKNFPGSVGSMDYSGFGDEHTENLPTKSAMEQAYGCRLMLLPYFDYYRTLMVPQCITCFLGQPSAS